MVGQEPAEQPEPNSKDPTPLLRTTADGQRLSQSTLSSALPSLTLPPDSPVAVAPTLLAHPFLTRAQLQNPYRLNRFAPLAPAQPHMVVPAPLKPIATTIATHAGFSGTLSTMKWSGPLPSERHHRALSLHKGSWVVMGVVEEDAYGRRKEWEHDESVIRAAEAVTRPD